MRKFCAKASFLRACLRLHLRVVQKRLPALLAMGLAVVFLAAGVALVTAQLYAGRGFVGMRIAVASEEANEQIDLLLSVLAKNQDIGRFASVWQVPVQDAERLVRTGGANAAVVLPRGFVQSLMTGENLSPRLLLDASRPLEMMMTIQLAENAARMLANAQQAVAYAQAVHEQQEGQRVPLNSVVGEVNLAFALWVLQRDGMFRSLTVGPAGALTLTQHYALGAVLFFAMLCAPVLYRLYALQEQKGWMARLRAAGCGIAPWLLSQLLAGALALLLLLCLLLAALGMAVGGGFSLSVLPGLALAALFLSCFGFVCCNLGSVLASVGVNFLVSLCALVVCGGVVPLVLLPAPVGALAALSPIGWMRGALAPLLGAGFSAPNMLALLAGTAALLGACLLLGRRHLGRYGEGAAA